MSYTFTLPYKSHRHRGHIGDRTLILSNIRDSWVWWPIGEVGIPVDIDWDEKIIKTSMTEWALIEHLRVFWIWDDFPMGHYPQQRKYVSCHGWEILIGVHPHWRRLFPEYSNPTTWKKNV